MSLLECIVKDGFISVDEPLTFCNMAADTTTFWMSWVKGHLRACLAISIVQILMDMFDTYEEVAEKPCCNP